MTQQQILEYLSTHKDRFEKQYYLHKIGIFGSYARGDESSDSDIDIVVELNKSTMFGLVGIKNDIEEYFKTHVDIVQIRDRMNGLLRERIDKEAIYV